MTLKEYIKYCKNIYMIILEFFSNDENEDFGKQFDINKFKIVNENKKDELKSLLHLIVKIADNFHRTPYFFNKVEQILHYFFNKIKKNLTNLETFQLFQSNKRILLFLIQNKIITIDKEIAGLILLKFSDRVFFYPEIRKFITENERKIIEEELLIYDSDVFENFEEKRQAGENESYLAQLIRKDSIDEFIIYMNRHNLPFSFEIEPSIFETNPFLIDKKVSLIEYASFFGSIQIFQFLRLNGIDLKESLWFNVIHSNNGELIHLLEQCNVMPLENDYEDLFIESIKCHHNNIANYMANNFLIKNVDQNDNQFEFSEKATESFYKYYNYDFISDDFKRNHSFYYLNRYYYHNIVNLYINTIENKIKEKIILIRLFNNVQSFFFRMKFTNISVFIIF